MFQVVEEEEALPFIKSEGLVKLLLLGEARVLG